MIALGNKPLTACEVWNHSQATSSSETSRITENLTKVGRALNANRHIAEQVDRNLHANWANRSFSVLRNVDFAQLFSDVYGEQWKHWQRRLNESRSQGDVVRDIRETMSASAYSNLISSVIRFGVIEAAELAPMELMSLVNTNLRLGPGSQELPLTRAIADIADDGLSEWEPTVTKGVPTANKVTLPRARKIRLAFKMSREMMDINGLANNYIRGLIDAHREALSLHAEKLLADCIFGLYDTATAASNPFPYILDGIQYNTYQTTAPWINDITGAGLDGTQVPFQLLEAAIEGAVDPYSGEIVDYSRNSKLLVTNRNAVELAKDALGAVHLVRDTASVAGSARQEIDRMAGSGRFQVAETDIVMSRHARPRLETWMQTAAGGSENAANAKIKAGTIWIYGDFARAFAFGTEWERETTEISGTNTQAYFDDDTVMQIRWQEKTTPAVVDPIRVIRCRATPTA